jgi:hypothetical protein
LTIDNYWRLSRSRDSCSIGQSICLGLHTGFGRKFDALDATVFFQGSKRLNHRLTRRTERSINVPHGCHTPTGTQKAENASRGQYHRSENVQSYASFSFEGEGLRIRYVAARNMGIFQVVVDGAVIDTVDAYAPELAFPGTRVYAVGRGTHTLELRSAQGRNPQSEGYVLALDAIQVFRGTANTLIIPPPVETYTPTPQPMPAAGVELVGAPPTVQPTTTPIPPSLVTVSVVIAYDENGNRAVDPAEGVSGISVRVVEVGTNRVITQAFTDSSGFAQLQVVTSAQARVVVPYFGKVWQLPNSRRGGNVRFTLLLTPGNQPGLIP